MGYMYMVTPLETCLRWGASQGHDIDECWRLAVASTRSNHQHVTIFFNIILATFSSRLLWSCDRLSEVSAQACWHWQSLARSTHTQKWDGWESHFLTSHFPGDGNEPVCRPKAWWDRGWHSEEIKRNPFFSYYPWRTLSEGCPISSLGVWDLRFVSICRECVELQGWQMEMSPAVIAEVTAPITVHLTAVLSELTPSWGRWTGDFTNTHTVRSSLILDTF